MTWNAAGEGELFKHFLHPFLVLRDVWISLAVGALEPGVGNETRAAMPGANDVNHVQIALFDKAIEVHIDEIQAGRRAPMADQARFDVLFLERLLQQGIVVEIGLTYGEIIRGAPPGVYLAKQAGV